MIETSLIEGGGIEDIEDTIENLVYGGKISQSESTMVNNVRHIELLERGRDFSERCFENDRGKGRLSIL